MPNHQGTAGTSTSGVTQRFLRLHSRTSEDQAVAPPSPVLDGSGCGLHCLHLCRQIHATSNRLRRSVARCVQSGKNTSPTTQAIQSLILPQTMSPDDSSLPAQAGFTRTFSIASLLHFLSSFCVCSLPLRFPSLLLSSLRILVGLCYGCHSGGTYGTSKQWAGCASNRQPLAW